MRFVIYKGIIISVFCKGTFMSRALCETQFSRSFAECDLSEKCSPIPDSLGLLRHSTRCSDAGGGSADGGTFQLTLDTKSNWPHVSRWELQWGSSAHCYLLGAFFTELPKRFVTGFCLLRPGVNNWSVGLSRSNSWGFTVWLYHLLTLLRLSALCCVLQRGTIALAAEGKANQTCQSPLLLNTATNDCSICSCFPGH